MRVSKPEALTLKGTAKAMDAFTSHTGVGVPLRRSNVDTDQIIPAEYLKRVTRNGFEDGLFSAWRADPSFVLNRAEYAAGSVLVAGIDFGTGSSREHAVWALQDYGFRVVVAPRFGDIFRGNSGKAGLLAAQVDEKVVQRLWDHLESNPGATVTVDLESRTVRAGQGHDAIEDSFDIDDYTRWRLLEGLDDVGITLSHADDIASYEANRPGWKPVTQRV
jgi:3-isopropylmalate/(R)-2-methylmalate dehydratase small subunit